MSWRGVHLSRPAYLSLERRALKISFRDDEDQLVRLPLEDLSYLILDTPETVVSGHLMSGLADAGVVVVGVDSRHLPAWTSLPWTRFHRHGEVISLQLGASAPQKKRLWSHIVRKKLAAQASCLRANALTGAEALENLLPHVRSGDPENLEARGARFYWQHLFPSREFRRHADDLPNALLNYGYALLRAVIARELCGNGFIPQLGLHHESVTNAYNLADDLIEPYRPLADHFVVDVLGDTAPDAQFTTDHRRGMTRLLDAQLELGEESVSTVNAIRATVASLKRSLASRNPALLKFGSLLQP